MIVLNLTYNKNKLYKNLDYWYRDILNVDFLENSLGIVSSPCFVYDFSRKVFLLLCSINWLNLIAWLPLLLFFFLNCYLAALRPTLSHPQGDSLTNQMLIPVFLTISTRRLPESRSEVGSLGLSEDLAGFEPGTFRL